MLKAHVGTDLWLVQQPHHAQVSGYLAAHWGGRNGFAAPGQHTGATHPDRWRDEVVLGIAEHDNGWWETEAMPRISARDGLPVGVGEAGSPTEENEFTAWSGGGLDRWRLGIGRLADAHPYAALLSSMHAYWLYAPAFADLTPDDDLPRRHFVFGGPEAVSGLLSDPPGVRLFLEEQADLQAVLMRRLSRDPAMAGAIEPAHRHANFRLLQLLDSMSLFLALDDRDEHQLPGIPRASIDDRVTISWRRRDARTIELDPYPFAEDDLMVSMLTRVVPAAAAAPDGTPPMARLHGTPLQSIRFTLTSGRG